MAVLIHQRTLMPAANIYGTGEGIFSAYRERLRCREGELAQFEKNHYTEWAR